MLSSAIAWWSITLNQRLHNVQALSPVIKEQALDNISQQRQTL